MTTDDHTQPCDCHKQTLANGGIVKTPEGQPPIGRTGCSIPGYCPTHDGHVITIRDGKPVDVTEDTTRARLPEDE